MSEDLHPPRPGNKRLRRLILTGLQMLITAGVLYFLLHDPEKRSEFGRVLRQANRRWLLAGILAYGLVEWLASLRWERLLRVQGIVLGRARMMTLLLIGVFFNFFIPGGTGGDVVKVFYLLKEAPGRGSAAVLSVLIDRIVGLFSLIFLAAFFVVMRWEWLTSTEETRSCVYTTLIILGISGGFVVFASILSGFGMVHRLPMSFPARERLAELALALNQYGRSKLAVLYSFTVSVGVHLAYILTFYCATRALVQPERILPSFLQLAAVMPIVDTITSLPISIGGLGLREGLFEVFLHQLADVDGAVAMAISSTGFLLMAAWGAVGAVLYFFYRPSEHAQVEQITEAVAAMEHEVAEAEIALETAHGVLPSCHAPRETSVR